MELSDLLCILILFDCLFLCLFILLFVCLFCLRWLLLHNHIDEAHLVLSRINGFSTVDSSAETCTQLEELKSTTSELSSNYFKNLATQFSTTLKWNYFRRWAIIRTSVFKEKLLSVSEIRTLLTLSVHASEDYSSHFVCLSVTFVLKKAPFSGSKI